jgi:hypothetical protein
MLKWFDTSEVDQFAKWLTSELLDRYPPAGLDTNAKKAKQRFEKVHDSLIPRVQAFAGEHQLNIYKRAQLGNRIKWALREAGYPIEFAETFTHEIVTIVAVVRPAPTHVSGKNK